MGADIRLIWRIGPTDDDALQFAYSTDDPERALAAIAGRRLAGAFASETIDSVLGENRAALAAAFARTIQDGADRAKLGITLVAVVIEAMHPPTGAASAFHAVQAAELGAQTSVATERGTAIATRAQAQTVALETLATAAGDAAETRSNATAALTGFEADRVAAATGGPTFAFERCLSNLTTIATRTERLSLPEAALAATVGRMRAERETVAAARTSEGARQAAEIRAEATRDTRLMQAKARTEAAEIEATSRREAAGIYARAYAGDPQLYLTIRSLDALSSVVNANTRILLRTDALPFRALIAPPAPDAAAPAAGLIPPLLAQQIPKPQLDAPPGPEPT